MRATLLFLRAKGDVMKIYELAKELGVQSKDVVALLKESGQEDVNHMSTLSYENIEFVKAEFSTVAAIKEQEKLDELEKLEKVAKIEEVNKKKTDADYKPDEMIPCRSVFAGVLIFTGDHTGMTYKFNGMGDRRNIEYQDLKAGMLQQKASMFNPDFIIEDSNLIEDERWYELKEVYESMYDEDDIKKVMELPTRNFEDAFVKLPVTAKNSIITMIATQIENGTFEQYNKAKIIDKVCGTRFDLKM